MLVIYVLTARPVLLPESQTMVTGGGECSQHPTAAYLLYWLELYSMTDRSETGWYRLAVLVSAQAGGSDECCGFESLVDVRRNAVEHL